MKRIVLISTVLWGYFNCLAQAPDWYFTFGAPGAYSSIFDLQIDDNGDLYALAMIFPETDVDPGPEELILESSLRSSRALLKYSADGKLIWGKSLGNLSGKLRLNQEGEIILAGSFWGETQLGDQTFKPVGGQDHFLAKLSSEGELIWGFSMGSESDENLFDLELDQAGNILIYGDYMGTMDVDPSEGTHQIETKGYRDVLVASYSTEGKFNWELNFGTSGNEFPSSMTVDQHGDIHISGTFLYSFQVKTIEGEQLVKKEGWGNIYWACIDATGQMQWIKTTGGSGYIGGGKLEEAADGTFWLLTGINNEMDIAFHEPQKILKSNTHDVGNLILAHYDTNQNLIGVRQFQSKNSADINDFYITQDGRLYISGNFRAELGVDWDPNAPQMSVDTLWDGFTIGLMPEEQNVFFAKHLKGPQGQGINVVREDQAGNIYLGASYMDNSIFDPDGINLELKSQGVYEALLMRFPAVVPQQVEKRKKDAKKKKKKKR